MFLRKVDIIRERGRVCEVRRTECCTGFVLHTGLEDPTTTVSERSLQEQRAHRICQQYMLHTYVTNNMVNKVRLELTLRLM